MASSQPGPPVPAAAAAGQPASPKTFMTPLGVHAPKEAAKVTQSQIDGPPNLAVKAFHLLLDRAQRNRDESGQPASFQYTLCFTVALVLVVTVVGAVLLEQAARRQRDKITSSTAEEEAKVTKAPGLRA
ncbi:uncharacterized protein LOC144102160 [Amblyomma americanum]